MTSRFDISCAVATLACALALCAFAPAEVAHADYVNPSVSAVANVRTDGSLHVAEQRTYDFDDEYSVLTWRITGWGGTQKVGMEAVRLMQADSEGNIVRDWAALPQVAFQSTWRDFVDDTKGLAQRVDAVVDAAQAAGSTADDVVLPKDEAWAFDSRRNVVYLFLRPTEATTAIECDYLVDNAALVWDDVGELYWDYVAVDDQATVRNVSVQVQLPVPEGAAVVPTENLLAWGHGAAGRVSASSDGTVDYDVPEVAPGQYAQAHIVFPRSWLANLTIQAKLAKSGVRYDDALADEAGWVDAYSTWRINTLVIDIVLLALCVVGLAGSVAAYALWGRERRPRGGLCADGLGCAVRRAGGRAALEVGAPAEDAPEGGALAGNVPEAASSEPARKGIVCDDALLDDAAVMGRLVRWNRESATDFPATLAQLERKGVVRIAVEPPVGGAGVGSDAEEAGAACAGAPGEEIANVRFRITPSAKAAPLSALEQDTMRFVFDVVGDGYQSVSLREIQAYCERHPDKVREAMGAWQAILTKEVDRAALFDRRSKKAALWVLACAALLACAAIYQLVFARSPLEAVALLATALAMAVVAHFIPRRTQRGADLAECARLCDAPDEGAPACSPGDDAEWMGLLSTMLEEAAVGRNQGKTTSKARDDNG